MLRIGLTGGIGAGKSTVSSALSDCGAVVVDGDLIAREVVEPGTEGLARLVDAFGRDILASDGALNRPALAAIAFSDDEKRATLNGIVHPLVGARRTELIAEARAAQRNPVIVEDIPLLVESHMAPMFPLVVIVHADPETRVRRLVEYRGFTEEDARARIAAQATDEQRRAVADVWLDNSGGPGELVEATRALWYERIEPFAENLAQHRPARAALAVVPYDPSWPDQARRILARLSTTCGHRARRIDHIGSTAVPGMDAKDIIDIQITVESLAVADELTEALLAAGYPRLPGVVADVAHTDDPAQWQKRFHASADPGRPTHLHLRVDGAPNQQFALMFVDWLAANPAAAQDYRELKLAAAERTAHPDPETHHGAYAEAKEPWFLDAYGRARAWAEGTGWTAG